MEESKVTLPAENTKPRSEEEKQSLIEAAKRASKVLHAIQVRREIRERNELRGIGREISPA